MAVPCVTSCVLPVCWQVRVRHTASGVSVSTTEKQNTGRMYAKCLLRELGKPDDFTAWAQHVVEQGQDATGAYPGIGQLFGKLLQKVNAGETWSLPADISYGNPNRAIALTHPKEITFAMRAALDAVLRDKGQLKVERGHFQRYASYAEVEKLLRKRTADAVADTGDEAKQRRSITLLDSEQLSLFESILSCSFAASQRKGGSKEDACRKPIDTLTLGVITAVYFALYLHASGGKLAKAGIIYKERRAGGNIKNGTFLKSKALKSSCVEVKKAERAAFMNDFLKETPDFTNLPTDFDEQLRSYFPDSPSATTNATAVPAHFKYGVKPPKMDWRLITTYDDFRFCPRCIEFNMKWAPIYMSECGVDAYRWPVRLAPREQFCKSCKEYNWEYYRTTNNMAYSPPDRDVPY
jgi:hypothetical protein